MSLKYNSNSSLLDKNQSSLVFLRQQNFSAVASVSFDNIFTLEFSRYKIVVNSTNVIRLILRASAVDNSSTNCASQRLEINHTTSTAERNTSLSDFRYLQDSTSRAAGLVEIQNPFQSANTVMIVNQTRNPETTSIRQALWWAGINSTNQFDGFKAAALTGTIAGNIAVYGYVE